MSSIFTVTHSHVFCSALRQLCGCVSHVSQRVYSVIVNSCCTVAAHNVTCSKQHCLTVLTHFCVLAAIMHAVCMSDIFCDVLSAHFHNMPSVL